PRREIVALAGKSRSDGLKAILVGGPAGGILPEELAATAYEFEALRAVGAHVGSGSVVAADKRACVVDLARLLTRFCADEACGKTIPCRIGLRRVSEIGDRIATGLPKPTDGQLLADLSADIVGSALCDHERLATLPFASGMRYFRSELGRDNGIEIPTLCYEPKLPGFGACRMCVVEVEGEEHPPISCSRSCEDGMKVQTQTEEVRRLRRTNLELIFSDHNAYCLPPCQ